jgi:hypothetical protein
MIFVEFIYQPFNVVKIKLVRKQLETLKQRSLHTEKANVIGAKIRIWMKRKVVGVLKLNSWIISRLSD